MTNPDHAHAHVQAQQMASPGSIITLLNQRLDEKAQHIRRLEDSEVGLAARINDQNMEITGLRAGIDQISAENRILRERLGLPQSGAIELTDEEVAALDPSIETTEEPAVQPGDPEVVQAVAPEAEIQAEIQP